MINVYSHAHLESLAELLSFKIKQHPLDVFEAETVCVANPIVQRWLSVQIAKHNGIEANVEYPLAANLIWRLLKKAGLNCPDTDPLALESLVWKIISLLPQLSQNEEFSGIKKYLDDDEDGTKQWQLAKKIADVFDRYQYHRPEALLTEAHNMEPWLKTLWKKLVADVPNHKIKLIFQFMEWMQQGKIPSHLLPKRIHVFSPSFLPKIVFQFFEALSQSVEINFYVVSPTNQYWGDLTSPKKLAKARLSDNPDAVYWDIGNALLSSWGKVGQIFHDQLIVSQRVEYMPQVNPLPAPKSLLQTIQNDIFNLSDRQYNEPEIIKNDGTIKINCCHNKMRECQVLHDEILAIFEQSANKNQPISPENILILTPNVVDYAPYIEAVFSPSQHKPFIPWNINDIPVVDVSPIFDVFLQLFDLNEGRFKQSDVLAFLDLKECQNQFDLSASEVETIKGWIQKSHIHWGKNEQHKQQLGLPKIAQNTWRFGLDRMMASYALGNNQTLGDIVSINKIDGNEAETLGKFNRFYEALVYYAQRIDGDKTPQQWQKLSNEMLDKLFKENAESDNKQNIRECITDWLETVDTLGFEEKCHYQLVKNVLQEKLQISQKKIAFMSGGVTFSSMKPLRNIPAKVIFVMGMNEQDYPRKEVRPEFDEMSKNAKVGDPSIADEDRYLFLETLMAAREKLIFSYIAYSHKDNSEKQPSLLLSELIEYIDERFINEQQEKLSKSLITAHKLQAYCAYYYQQKKPKSYDRYWLPMFSTEKHNEQKTQWSNFKTIKQNIDHEEISLESLLSFYKNPSASFLRGNLKVYLKDEKQEINDIEPIDLDDLQQWQVKQAITEANLDGKTSKSVKDNLFKTGQLPISNIGDTCYKNVENKVSKLLQNLDTFKQGVCTHNAPAILCTDIRVGNQLTPFSLSVSLLINSQKNKNVTLVGQIKNLYPQHGLLKVRPGTVKGGDYLSLWIQFLILQLTKQNPNEAIDFVTNAQIISDKKLEMFDANKIDKATAQEYLNQLIDLYIEGKNKPIALFNLSSYEVALQIHKGKTEGELNKNSKWFSNKYYQGDEADLNIQMLLRQLDEQPTDSDEFLQIIKTIYLPMLNYLS